MNGSVEFESLSDTLNSIGTTSINMSIEDYAAANPSTVCAVEPSDCCNGMLILLGLSGESIPTVMINSSEAQTQEILGGRYPQWPKPSFLRSGGGSKGKGKKKKK